MIEHCLYGVKAYSDFPLFDRTTPVFAVAPGEHSDLQLKCLPEGSGQQGLTERIPLYTTHGREVWLCTDRELASSVPGQPWCLEVADVVSFSWVGGDSTIQYQLHEQGTQGLLVFWFVHIFLPLHLTLERGYDFIHCSAMDLEITGVTGFRKFEELLPNYLYNFSFLQKQRLRWLAQLADQSLVFRVRRPWNLERMHEVYEAICANTRGQV